jgi:hypothetical protein
VAAVIGVVLVGRYGLNPEGQDADDREVLEQQHREGALAVGRGEVAPFLQELQRDGGGGGDRGGAGRPLRPQPVLPALGRQRRPRGDDGPVWAISGRKARMPTIERSWNSSTAKARWP